MKRALTVMFDLDGTLIDSRVSIINSLKKALEVTGIKSNFPVNEITIGPPLTEVLSLVLGSRDSKLIAALAAKFREFYDVEGFKNSIKYTEADWLLRTLKETGIELSLVTNKRSIPTLKILKRNNWLDSFKHVYAIDSFGYTFKNKAEAIFALLESAKIHPSRALYVGDTHEDYDAARINDMKAILVAWGYGKNLHLLTGPSTVKSFSDLLNEINKNK